MAKYTGIGITQRNKFEKYLAEAVKVTKGVHYNLPYLNTLHFIRDARRKEVIVEGSDKPISDAGLFSSPLMANFKEIMMPVELINYNVSDIACFLDAEGVYFSIEEGKLLIKEGAYTYNQQDFPYIGHFCRPEVENNKYVWVEGFDNMSKRTSVNGFRRLAKDLGCPLIHIYKVNSYPMISFESPVKGKAVYKHGSKSEYKELIGKETEIVRYHDKLMYEEIPEYWNVLEDVKGEIYISVCKNGVDRYLFFPDDKGDSYLAVIS